MKLSSVFLAALAPIAAFALPSPVEEAAAAATQPSSPEPKFDTGSNTIEKRASRAVVVADGLRYRTCPRTSCTAVGQYARGTEVTLRCYTREGTTVVNGDAGWGKLDNGYWVALSNGDYVYWYSPLYPC
ncbi:hypothetical protein VTN49DRAFT_4801 [Thermomyces lanuginosus]|uniref:uncharacterized protein n=1 Tax=Thermomyces lanuginosus TaxID=5541 RepID=UPI003743602F